MTSDLKERFGLAEEVDAPDLWTEARRRAAAPELPLSGFDRSGLGSRTRRITTAGVAFAVFAAAALFAWELSHPEQAPSPPRPVGLEPIDLAAELGRGWTELPGPPELLGGAASAWTGSAFLLWGGEAEADVLADEGFGFSFDGASRTWSPIPDGPLSPRLAAASAWTGRELLVWGGRTGGCCVPERFFGDGAAYDPSNRTWRMLARAPIQARSPFSVWTGRELLVWGNQDRDVRYSDGAAYDPVTDTWRRIADGPIEITDGTAVWTGTEMIVFGAALHGGNVPESKTGIGAAYDPETDRWHELPPSLEIDPNANAAVWAGDRLIAVDFDSDAEAFEPASGRWRRHEPMPLDDGEDVPRAAFADGWTFVNFFGQVAAFSSETERWTDLTHEVPGKDPPIGTPLAAGGAFLLPTRSSELSEQPSVELDTRLLAWVPPNASTDLADGSIPFVPQTEVVGDETRMPIVFPDGTKATLTYPAELRLAELGVQPDVWYHWREDPEHWFPIVFIHDPEASIASYVDEVGPVRLMNTSSGGVEVWGRSHDALNGFDVPDGNWLRYRLGQWTVLVAIGPVEDATGIAAYMSVRQTITGFPVVTATDPIILNQGHSDAGGPQLAFGDLIPNPGSVTNDDVIVLFPYPCTPGTELGPPGYGYTCLADGAVSASVSGEQAFVSDVVEGLHVEDLVAAPATTCVEPARSIDRERAGSVAETFLSMRVQGVSEAELGRVMSSSAVTHWNEPDESPGPLMGDYAGYEVVFVDGPLPVVPNGEPMAFEIGIRLTTGDGDEVTETLFVGPGTNVSGDPCPFIVDGGRSGLDGP